MANNKSQVLHLGIVMLFSAALAIIGTDELHKRYLKGEFQKSKSAESKKIVANQGFDGPFDLKKSRAQRKIDGTFQVDKNSRAPKSWLGTNGASEQGDQGYEEINKDDRSWLDKIIGN